MLNLITISGFDSVKKTPGSESSLSIVNKLKRTWKRIQMHCSLCAEVIRRWIGERGGGRRRRESKIMSAMQEALLFEKEPRLL